VLAAEPLFRMRPYFLSEQFSLLDAAVAPVLWRLRHWGIDLPEDAVHLRRYTVRVFARPSFRFALSEPERGMRS
jgi:RNA polymerase-associated protein